MSRSRFILFLTLALSIYLAFSTIIFLFGWYAFIPVPALQMAYAITFWFFTPLFFVARILEFVMK